VDISQLPPEIQDEIYRPSLEEVGEFTVEVEQPDSFGETENQ